MRTNAQGAILLPPHVRQDTHPPVPIHADTHPQAHPPTHFLHIYSDIVYATQKNQAEEFILGHNGLIQLVIRGSRLVVKDVLETAGPKK